MARTLILQFVVAATALGAAGDDPARQFEMSVRPLLAEKCLGCHGDAKSGGLRLDSREALLTGGKSGPAIKVGDPDGSILVQAIRQTHEKLKMPPGGKLKDEQISAVAGWIKAGAVWPAGPVKAAPYVITSDQRNFWSFRPIANPPLPPVKDAKWARNGIDRFILSKLEEKGLSPAPAADRRTLIRRAYLDLTGLPPTLDEVTAFVNDKSPDAFAKVVDKLLASSRYGERWGRYWLDVARYSDDKLNSTDDEPYTNSFRYRDWVISAFNRDMPWNQFAKAQIAGDLMDAKENYQPGLGFFSLSPEMQDDRVDALTRGFLGMTVACAQCHNHKFDPIPQADYYSLLGIFNNTELSQAPLAPPDTVERYKAAKKKLEEKKKELDDYVKEHADSLAEVLGSQVARYMLAVSGDVPGGYLDAETFERMQKYLAKPEKDHPYLKAWFAAKTPDERKKAAQDFQDLLMAVNAEKKLVDEKNKIKLGLDPSRNDLSQASLDSIDRDKFVLWNETFGGQFKYGAGKVDRFLNGPWKERLATLQAEHEALKAALPPEYPYLQTIQDKKKLGVQKIWLRGSRDNPGDPAPPHFMTILSPADPKPFTNGAGRLELAEAIADPANPLAARVFVNRVWQHHFGQGLVRTPSDFGMQGDRPSHPELLDYLATQFVQGGWSVKKLHRSIMLSSAYQLGTEPLAKNMTADPENRLVWRYNRRRVDAEALRDDILDIAGKLDLKEGGKAERLGKDNVRRTVYTFVSRRKLDSEFALFDFPNPNASSEQRTSTNTPLQRLYFMNNAWVIAQAKAAAERAQGADTKRVTDLYGLVLQRGPSAAETKVALEYLRTAGPDAWTRYAQVLMTSNEFQFIE